MQEDIYRQMQLLLPDTFAHHDRFVSRVDGSPQVLLEVLERHRYTNFIKIGYMFEKPEEHPENPQAHLRLYEDARMAEVTAFNPEQGVHRSAHPWYPSLALFRRAWRHNLAMGRWLDYLLKQGHSLTTMAPLTGPAASAATPGSA